MLFRLKEIARSLVGAGWRDRRVRGKIVRSTIAPMPPNRGARQLALVAHVTRTTMSAARFDVRP
jgi:hypothetical protein